VQDDIENQLSGNSFKDNHSELTLSAMQAINNYNVVNECEYVDKTKKCNNKNEFVADLENRCMVNRNECDGECVSRKSLHSADEVITTIGTRQHIDGVNEQRRHNGLHVRASTTHMESHHVDQFTIINSTGARRLFSCEHRQ